MSIATQQQIFYKSNKHQQPEEGFRTLAHNQQEGNRKKSIDSYENKQVKHVTNKVLKSKQLLRQTPVAGNETEEQPEVNKAKEQIQETYTRRELTEIKDNYLNEEEQKDLKDFRIYQNGKVNDFFKTEIKEIPKKISDICLVNDHYILVKMPNPETPLTNNNSLEAAAIRRQDFKALKEHNERILKESEKDNKPLCRYLKSKRNRITRIAPIHEEPEDFSDNENKTQSKYCLKMQSCWQVNDQEPIEIYETQTKIHKPLRNSTNKGFTKSSNDLSTYKSPEKPISQALKTSPNISTISGNLLKSSPPQKQVTLHTFGSLKESSENYKNLDTINNSPRKRKCPRFESFYWLLRPFRGKYRKPKPKIQAVVYKTYFVKWTKPPDSLNHGYGVKSAKSPEMEVSVLRRCRSAIF